MNKILRPAKAKPIWGRSGALVGGVLIAFREIVPEAPWWASLILAVAVLAVEQLRAPSQKADA